MEVLINTTGETVAHGLEVARDSGVCAVFDMPNTDPPIMAVEDVRDRLRLADSANVSEVFYGIYMGLTADLEQVSRAVQVVGDFFPRVPGMKLYAGHSTGNLGVINVEDQERIYETVSNLGYQGILAVHCEKEGLMDSSDWDFRTPISHCFARPERAEVESVRDQLSFAEKYNFPGKLHIVHVSSPGAVKLINEYRGRGLDVSCGICPHHFIFDYNRMLEDDGIHFKMNPPLRKPESRERMFDFLRDGSIDWVETDHAPHRLARKAGNGAASGITGLQRWDLIQEYLRHHDFSDDQVKKVTFENARDRVGIDVEDNLRHTRDRSGDYEIDFYGLIAREIGYEG